MTDDNILRILSGDGFSDKETGIIRQSYAEYEDLLKELEAQIELHNRLREKLNDLHTKYARYSYELYETYMAVHINAISISARRGELSLMGKEIPKAIQEDMDSLLDQYTIITKFY